MAYRKNSSPVRVSGLSVEVKGNFEKSLRLFTKKVQNSGIMNDVRKKEYFEKPAAVRRRAKQTSVKREQKRVHDDRQPKKWD